MIHKMTGTTEPTIDVTCEWCTDAGDVAVLMLMLVDEADSFDCVVLSEGIYAFDDWTVM